MTSGTFQRLTSRTPNYDVTMLGYNYRMDELRAAMGLVQLQKLQSWNEKRKNLSNLYKQLLPEACSSISVPFSGWNALSSHHIMPILLPSGHDRQSVVSHLRDASIQTTIHYPPAHRLSLYQDLFPSIQLDKTEEFSDRELTLPLHPMMEDEHVERVVKALKSALAD
jgi:dTDP-4-amino-4,6-dideoxygalactose transaminase